MVDTEGKQDRGTPATGETREHVMLARCAPKIGDTCTIMSRGSSEYRDERRFHEYCHGKKAAIVGVGTNNIDIKMLEGVCAGEVFRRVAPEILLVDGTFVR